MRHLFLALLPSMLAFMLSSSAHAASYQQKDGTIIDPILYTAAAGGGVHPYSGKDLEPGTDFIGVDLPNADLPRANLSSTLWFGAEPQRCELGQRGYQ